MYKGCHHEFLTCFISQHDFWSPEHHTQKCSFVPSSRFSLGQSKSLYSNCSIFGWFSVFCDVILVLLPSVLGLVSKANNSYVLTAAAMSWSSSTSCIIWRCSHYYNIFYGSLRLLVGWQNWNLSALWQKLELLRRCILCLFLCLRPGII